MKIITLLTDPPTVRAILLHLELPQRPSPVARADLPSPSSSSTSLRPSTFAFDVSDPEPVPDFNFDQSSPELPEWPESDG